MSSDSYSPSSDPRITPAMEDYLKTIYELQIADQPVTNQSLADALGYSGASVTNMQKRLQDLHLLEVEPYKGARLTTGGRAVALEVIRHHRLLELFLAQTLGMNLDAVHAEADRLEHHVSEELEDLIASALGFPQFDPHGDPIPTPELTLPEINDIPLAEAPRNERVQVTRVSDRDPDTVRRLVASGVVPGVFICGVEAVADGENWLITFCSGTTVAVTSHAVASVRVQPQTA